MGTAIVAQTLYSSTKDHLYEFATLRAMGATNDYIYKVIICQVLIDAVIGFCIAAIIGIVVVHLTSKSALQIVITHNLMLESFVLTVVMCIGSAIAATLRVIRLDPVLPTSVKSMALGLHGYTHLLKPYQGVALRAKGIAVSKVGRATWVSWRSRGSPPATIQASCYIGGDYPRLVFGGKVSRRSRTRRLLEVDIGELLTHVVRDDKEALAKPSLPIIR